MASTTGVDSCRDSATPCSVDQERCRTRRTGTPKSESWPISRIPQEICEERGGEWVDRDGRSACVWPEYDRDCDKDDDSEDDGSDDRLRRRQAVKTMVPTTSLVLRRSARPVAEHGLKTGRRATNQSYWYRKRPGATIRTGPPKLQTPIV